MLRADIDDSAQVKKPSKPDVMPERNRREQDE